MPKLSERAEQWGPTTLAVAVVALAVESRLSDGTGADVMTERITQLQTGFAEFSGEISGAVSRIEDQSTDMKIRQAVFDQLMQTRVTEINDLRERVENLEKRP